MDALPSHWQLYHMDQAVFQPALFSSINPSNAKATYVQKHKDAKIFENRLNPVMLVFIG